MNLIDANKLRRQALDYQAQCYYGKIIAEIMLAEAQRAQRTALDLEHKRRKEARSAAGA